MALGGIRKISTGNPHVDGLLSGRQWLSSSLTYAFPATASVYGFGYGNGEPEWNFAPVAPAMMQAFRSFLEGANVGPGALTPLAGFAQFVFAESKPGTGPAEPDILIAGSSLPSTAYAYSPDAAPYGGDVWFGRTYDFTAPRAGSYAFATAMHEFGHALGLKHPHDLSQPNGAAMPLDRDSHEYTLMSYRSVPGASLTGAYSNEPTSYPQTYMMLDILALQTLYGANYAFRSANTTYSWNPATGEAFVDGIGQGAPAGNRIFCTIWDGGGADTFDFSAYADPLTINLEPGSHSALSPVQRAELAPRILAAGNVYNALLFQGDPRSLIEDAIGGSGRDTISGNRAANFFAGRNGDDLLKGGDGDDRLDGGRGSDHLWGGPGADWLSGKLGRDGLSGGSGRDVFVFDTKSGKTNRDKISDFNVRDDTIWLDNAVFKALGRNHHATPEKLAKGFFAVGHAARDRNDHILYDKQKGLLLYDPDGIGKSSAVEIAALPKKLKMTAADFLII